MDVSFRSIVEDDFQTICDLMPSQEELFLIYDRGRYPLTVSQVRKLVEHRMDPTVMLHRGEVVGFGDFYNYCEGKSVFIGNIVVDRSLRGKGLGRRLVCYLIARAFNEYDLPSVRMHVYSRNAPALLLYSKLGFQPCAMKVKIDYAGEPAMCLSLQLRRDTWLGR
jgi:ribosomal protein S18 acetylase RimI-like enzyme